MKNLILHKYFTINLFIYINIICIINFVIMLCMFIINPKQFPTISKPIFDMAMISFFIIPVLIILIMLEYILRKCLVIKISCNDFFSQLQIRILYSIAVILAILYLTRMFQKVVHTPFF